MNFSPFHFLILHLPSRFIIFFSSKHIYMPTMYTCFVFTKFFGTILTKSKLNFIFTFFDGLQCTSARMNFSHCLPPNFHKFSNAGADPRKWLSRYLQGPEEDNAGHVLKTDFSRTTASG